MPNRCTDQVDPEDAPTRRKWHRSIAPLSLLAILLLALLPVRGGWDIRFLAAVVFLLVSIVSGILARQWILVYVAMAPILIAFGIVILATLSRSPGGRNESAAKANLRTINTAEVTYLSSSDGAYGTLDDLIAARLLDDTFAGTKAGYNYSITLDATGSAYTAEAVPASTKTGRYGYYSVPDAVVRYSLDASLAPAGQSGRSVQ